MREMNTKTQLDDAALRYHSEGRPGKIGIVPTKPYHTQYDLSLAYSPGVAAPSLAIAEEPDNVYKYTGKGNLVAVISNGTAVLGLGNIGPLAAKPVMEGKTPCYRNVSHPIAGIVRLSQAPQNRIRRLRPIEAIGALLPSCPPSFAHDERLEDAICRLVSQIVAQVPVYHLECLPDAAAARLSCRTVFGDDAPNTLR